MQEDLAEERRRPDPRFAHSDGVGLVNLRLQQLSDEGKEDFTKDGGPLFVVWRGQIAGDEGPL